MAIDVLSRRSATPILVGDAEDVQAYRRCYIDESTVPAHLVLSAADEVGVSDAPLPDEPPPAPPTSRAASPSCWSP